MDLELRESKTALPIHELWTLVYTTASKTTEQAMDFMNFYYLEFIYYFFYIIRDSALSSTRQGVHFNTNLLLRQRERTYASSIKIRDEGQNK